ncbi:MAG: hypothetical protein MRY83_01120 [Flavobacteriales bacterium]|nr:hypothetical protein [Flavobacteriales bacterium]
MKTLLLLLMCIILNFGYAQNDTITINNITVITNSSITLPCANKVEIFQDKQGIHHTNLSIQTYKKEPNISLSFDQEPDSFKVYQRVAYRNGWRMSETEGVYYYKINDLDTNFNMYDSWKLIDQNNKSINLSGFKNYPIKKEVFFKNNADSVRTTFKKFMTKYYGTDTNTLIDSKIPPTVFNNEVMFIEYRNSKVFKTILTFEILLGEC